MGKTQPDVHLIKQVEQVTKSALGGPMWRFPRDSEHGVTGSVEILLFLIWQLPYWLLFGCKKQPKHPEEAEGDLWQMLPALTGGATNRAHGLRLGTAGLQRFLTSVVTPTR